MELSAGGISRGESTRARLCFLTAYWTLAIAFLVTSCSCPVYRNPEAIIPGGVKFFDPRLVSLSTVGWNKWLAQGVVQV